MPSTLSAQPAAWARAKATTPPVPDPDGLITAAHWSRVSLPSRLNDEWALLCRSDAGRRAAGEWALATPSRAALTGLVDTDGLHAVVQLLHSPRSSGPGRDVTFVGLLGRSQDGDRLAGRVVLQAMLPAAVRIAQAITHRPDVLGDQDEAFALVLAALWQVIATYPVTRRPQKVPANLYLDTLALVRRGHTSSSHRAARVFPEQSFADIRTAAEPGRLDAERDDLVGPADAQLCTVLAWAVRQSVITAQEARLLVRVYGLDGGPAATGPAVAAEHGVSWPTLRQRCHRLARRIGTAAVAAELRTAAQPGAVLCAA